MIKNNYKLTKTSVWNHIYNVMKFIASSYFKVEIRLINETWKWFTVDYYAMC